MDIWYCRNEIFMSKYFKNPNDKSVDVPLMSFGNDMALHGWGG